MTTIYGLWYKDNSKDKGGWIVDGSGNIYHSRYACVMAAQCRYVLSFGRGGLPEVKIIGADGLPDEETNDGSVDQGLVT